MNQKTGRTPFITLIMPVYNAEKYLPECGAAASPIPRGGSCNSGRNRFLNRPEKETEMKTRQKGGIAVENHHPGLF